MSRVYLSLGKYGFEGINQEYLELVFQITNRLAQGDTRHEIGVAVIDGGKMRKLNREHRGKDASTNVLAFAYNEIPDPINSEQERFYLGDIYICYDEVLKEAGEKNLAAKEALTGFLVHGILHLLGFDHEQAKEASAMEELESVVLAGVLL